MAVTNAPPPDALKEVARQVARRLVVQEGSDPIFSISPLNERGSPSRSVLEMGVTLALWRLTPAAVDRSGQEGADLAKLATPAGRWHHQIKFDDGDAAFARSRCAGEASECSVDEIFVSPLAEQIAEAVELAETEFPGDDLLARLLTAPAYKVEALWFVNKAEAERRAEKGGELLIVTAPADIYGLAPLRRIAPHDFLEALRGAPVGLGLKGEASD
jgi:hypothetical protein